MPYIKLIKLLYLAERKSVAKWGTSMSGDSFVSMPHGPVLSQTYDLIKGSNGSEGYWAKMIHDEADYNVSLSRKVTADSLDELSRSEIKILNEIFIEFGRMNRFEIVNYTHDHCREWQNPHGSSYPIKLESVLRAMGKSQTEIDLLLERNGEEMILQSLRASLSVKR